jgi:hypothetical protein
MTLILQRILVMQRMQILQRILMQRIRAAGALP